MQRSLQRRRPGRDSLDLAPVRGARSAARTMMRFSLLLCCGIWLVAGCGDNRQDDRQDDPRDDQAPAGSQAALPPGVDARYQAEVADICFAEERSGALQQDESQRLMIVAQWLGTRIGTQQGRDFLAGIARAAPAEKVTLLQAESRRVGLASCPLVQSWGGPAPGAATGAP
jgi:hypothetical protein